MDMWNEVDLSNTTSYLRMMLTPCDPGAVLAISKRVEDKQKHSVGRGSQARSNIMGDILTVDKHVKAYRQEMKSVWINNVGVIGGA